MAQVSPLPVRDQPDFQRPSISILLTNACASECRCKEIQKDKISRCFRSDRRVCYDCFMSGCMIQGKPAAALAVATNSLTHLYPCASSRTRFVASQTATQGHAKRRKTTDQHHSPPAFFPHIAIWIADQGPSLSAPNHGTCRTGNRFLVCPSPATARMAFGANRMSCWPDPGQRGQLLVDKRQRVAKRGCATAWVRFAAEQESLVAGRSEHLDLRMISRHAISAGRDWLKTRTMQSDSVMVPVYFWMPIGTEVPCGC